mmetsp:Transcript_38102/g.118464  ORF Transcript_38102/g.118464 Transcript_38102/m.118464 type:complete len:669 (+) Transcript_38102:65-2071(+)
MASYTPDQVDALITKFEKAAEKQIAKAPENIASLDKEMLKPMFCATEVSLMSVAEEVRDLCAKAVLGSSAADRDYLDDVFGRGCNCERFIRLRDIYGKVVLSQMSCNDPRWKQVQDKISIIEEILAQRGSFKAPVGKPVEPSGLKYPSVSDAYDVGQQVNLEPTLGGGTATSFSIDSPLPAGLTFDPETGKISGAPKGPCPAKTYTITATNASGSTTATVRFGVLPPAPTGLEYGTLKPQYTVGDSVDCVPTVEGGACTDFAVEGTLPAGLTLDPTTGRLSGSLTEVAASTTFRITGSNAKGKVTFKCTLDVQEPEAKLIEKIIATTTAKDCLALDPGSDNLLTWMVWMVHRAHLDDDSLEELSFSDLSMPPPTVQPLVAPKLMKALLSNTHLATLKLCNSNFFRQSARELADVFKVSKTLKFVDISTNDLDAECIKDCAAKLMDNADTTMQTWFLSNQKSMGENVGNSCEKVLMDLMRVNLSITKLGVKIMDVGCRDNIDRYLIRNADRARRLLHGDVQEEEKLAEEKALSAVRLAAAPAKPASEIFSEDAEMMGIVRGYCAEKGQLPTNEQLQAFAKSQGKSIPFSKVAPVMKAFSTKLLDAAVGLKISLADAYGSESMGEFREWKENKGAWTFVAKLDEGSLTPYATKKQPPIRIQGDIIAWIQA